MADKVHLLTLKTDADTLAEFAAATTILRARSMSSHLHQFVVQQINEAKKMVEPKVFAELVAKHKRETEQRSKFRSNVRKRSLKASVEKPHLAPVVAHISGRERKPTHADVQKMIDGEAIGEIERRLKPRKTQRVPVLKQRAK